MRHLIGGLTRVNTIFKFGLVKLSEFVVFNVAIIIYSECYSSTLLVSLRSVQSYTVRISPNKFQVRTSNFS